MRGASALAAFLSLSVLAGGQNLVLTTRTHPTCPVETSGIIQSAEFGFQSVVFRNESPKFVEFLSLKVAFSTGDKEEIVDSLRLPVRLAPADAKQFQVQLGRVAQLNQKLRSSGAKFARVLIYVDSAEFSDGTEWRWEERFIDPPPARLK